MFTLKKFSVMFIVIGLFCVLFVPPGSSETVPARDNLVRSSAEVLE